MTLANNSAQTIARGGLSLAGTFDLKMKYQDVKTMSREEIEQIISWNDLNRLHFVPIALGLHCDDLHWGIGKCINLAEHPDPTVRGNALLSFGHFARRFHCAHRKLVEPLLQKGLMDKNPYVRRQAETAADDIDQFCTWKVDRKKKKSNNPSQRTG